MFGIGMPEMILILAIALIVIGPKKLPDLAKSLGRAFAEFKRATSELKESMDIDYDLNGVKKTFEDMKDELKDAVDLNGDVESDDRGNSIYENKKDDPTKAVNSSDEIILDNGKESSPGRMEDSLKETVDLNDDLKSSGLEDSTLSDEKGQEPVTNKKETQESTTHG